MPRRRGSIWLDRVLRVSTRLRACRYRLSPPRFEPARLLVDRTAWGWRVRDDLAIALFHLGDDAGCEAIYRQMLEDPNLPANERERIRRNLETLIPSR